MPTLEHPAEQADRPYAVEFRSGKKELHGEGAPAFTLSVEDESQLHRVLEGGPYATAIKFIRGRFEVAGDLVAALRLKRLYSHPRLLDRLRALALLFSPARLETWVQSRRQAAANIRSHYDVSNEFYGLFLDSRYIYSAAYFQQPGWSLEQAQEAKLDKICADLDLHPGERLLDVGCGWGALLLHAAERYGVHATGCTLSRRQYEYAESAVRSRGLADRVSVRLMDYRDLSGPFDKIASIGMFEHVGRHRLGQYLRKIYDLLEPGGLFLNSGITRPQNVRADGETSFLLAKVFPGGELAHISDVIRRAGQAGFEIRKLQNLRHHYARTCREWVKRLEEKKQQCLHLVVPETYRTWLLYLAASALNFERGETEVFSILMSKK